MDSLDNKESGKNENVMFELKKSVEETTKSNDEKKAIIAGLKYALENQINWQKYAEAKNLILCTVPATTLVNLIKFCIDGGKGVKFGLYTFLFFAAISFYISALSLIIRKVKNSNDSTFYIASWRYVRNKTYDELLELVGKYDEEHQIKDLTFAQLKGSQITYRKYMLFNVGVIFYVIGLSVLIVDIFLKFML